MTNRPADPTVIEMTREIGERALATRWALIIMAMAWLAAPGCTAFKWPDSSHDEAQALLQQGRAYLDEGLTDSALAAFGMALEADPDLVDAHMGMAGVYRQYGNYEVASRSYERAAELAPNSFEARYGHGWMQHLLGNIAQAVESYLRALSIQPNHFEANLHLGVAYLQLDKPRQALPYARRATELDGENQEAWANLATAYSLSGENEGAIEAYHQAIELGGLTEPIVLGLANAHINLGRFEQAVIVLESFTRQGDITSAAVYQRLGYAKFKLRQFDEALDSFRQALSLDDSDSTSLNGVGVCLMAQYISSNRAIKTQRDDALMVWRRSLELRPQQPHIANLLAQYDRM